MTAKRFVQTDPKTALTELDVAVYAAEKVESFHRVTDNHHPTLLQATLRDYARTMGKLGRGLVLGATATFGLHTILDWNEFKSLRAANEAATTLEARKQRILVSEESKHRLKDTDLRSFTKRHNILVPEDSTGLLSAICDETNMPEYAIARLSLIVAVAHMEDDPMVRICAMEARRFRSYLRRIS